MSVIKISNKDEFKNTLSKNKNAVVDFSAVWCSPCNMFAPVFEGAEKSHGDIAFISIDIDKCEDIANEFGVYAVPTIIRFEDGKETSRTSGYMDSVSFEKFLNDKN